MEFDDADTPTRGEVTRRTYLVEKAEQAARDSHMESMSARKAVWRFKSVWGIAVIIGAIAGIGYAVRDRMDHFATSDHLAATDAQVQRNTIGLSHVDDTLQAQRDAFNRLTDQVKDLVNIEMRRGREEERGNGR